MNGFTLQRLGMVMEPEPGNPQEIEGVLNPAAVRGPDGELYLFPRLTARGNYSRIGIARVRFNEAGDPAGVERLGIALEPEADYERRPDGGGTPPVLTRHGWLIIYHGVSEIAGPSNDGHRLCYSAGVMVRSTEHPRVIRYRSV